MDRAMDRELMRVVYLALVRDSFVPCDAATVGRSAVGAIARRGGAPAVTLPPDFGADVERDAAFLVEALPVEGPWWDVFAAMAWDAGVAHTAVTDASFRSGMAARLRGEPFAAPGFFLWRQSDGRLAVADLDPAGSGHASGLRPGDVVLEVDGRRRARRPNSEVLPFYTAPAGASFDLTIDRAGARRRVRLELAPGAVPCVTERRLAGGVGHLRVRWFATSTDPRHDVGALARRAVASLVADGAAGIVIDVRSGLGGQLSAADAIISLLCDAPIVGAHRAEDGVQPYPRAGPMVWQGAPVVVLVNEQTISAAEYLALGLEELAGATLVGTATAGGLNAIRFVDLADGYRIALPSGTTIGPRSREARPGFQLQPHVSAANPTTRELAAGVDPALDTARRVVLERRGATT